MSAQFSCTFKIKGGFSLIYVFFSDVLLAKNPDLVKRGVLFQRTNDICEQIDVAYV